MQDSGDRDTANTILVPARRGAISPFVVMDIMRAAGDRQAQGEDIVHMEVGQPGTPAPRRVREVVKAAVDSDVLGYTDALGNMALRERIARYYRESYGVSVGAERVVITSGSSAGFVLAFLSLFDPAARILMPEPGYPCYRNIVQVLGLEPVRLTVSGETRWMPTTALLASAGKVDGLLFASPANPTGTMLSDTALAEVCTWCRSTGVTLISDEIYHGLSYGAPAQTALQHHDGAIVINSFSKYYSMTGWRIGWMVIPAHLIRTFERVAQNLYISAPGVSQVAALAAFDAIEELEANKAIYAANRALLLEELPGLGFPRLAPADGAFYLYADVSHLTDDAGAFVRRMLAEIGVATTPGNDFDITRGNQFVRFSYAGATADMAKAVKRLRSWKK
jgi:aspartate/methionine/tyrosine aminotransferase